MAPFSTTASEFVPAGQRTNTQTALRRDSRTHLTVKSRATEENRDAASESSRVDPRRFRVRFRRHSIHNIRCDDEADRAAQILQILKRSGDIPYGTRRQDRKDSRP